MGSFSQVESSSKCLTNTDNTSRKIDVNEISVAATTKTKTTVCSGSTIKLPSSHTKQQQQHHQRHRTIRFMGRIKVRQIPHARRDFTDEELGAYWYTDEEYKRMKKEIFSIIYVMEKVDASTKSNKKGAELLKGWEEKNPTTICTRGLEVRTSKESKKRFQRRAKAIDAVLDEQENQQKNSKQKKKGGSGTGACHQEQDDEKIARLYQACTYEAVLAANLQGQRDQKETELIATRTEEMQSLLTSSPQSLNVQQQHQIEEKNLSPRKNGERCTKGRRWFKSEGSMHPPAVLFQSRT